LFKGLHQIYIRNMTISTPQRVGDTASAIKYHCISKWDLDIHMLCYSRVEKLSQIRNKQQQI